MIALFDHLIGLGVIWCHYAMSDTTFLIDYLGYFIVKCFPSITDVDVSDPIPTKYIGIYPGGHLQSSLGPQGPNLNVISKVALDCDNILESRLIFISLSLTKLH